MATTLAPWFTGPCEELLAVAPGIAEAPDSRNS